MPEMICRVFGKNCAFVLKGISGKDEEEALTRVDEEANEECSTGERLACARGLEWTNVGRSPALSTRFTSIAAVEIRLKRFLKAESESIFRDTEGVKIRAGAPAAFLEGFPILRGLPAKRCSLC